MPIAVPASVAKVTPAALRPADASLASVALPSMPLPTTVAGETSVRLAKDEGRSEPAVSLRPLTPEARTDSAPSVFVPSSDLGDPVKAAPRPMLAPAAERPPVAKDELRAAPVEAVRVPTPRGVPVPHLGDAPVELAPAGAPQSALAPAPLSPVSASEPKVAAAPVLQNLELPGVLSSEPNPVERRRVTPVPRNSGSGGVASVPSSSPWVPTESAALPAREARPPGSPLTSRNASAPTPVRDGAPRAGADEVASSAASAPRTPDVQHLSAGSTEPQLPSSLAEALSAAPLPSLWPAAQAAGFSLMPLSPEEPTGELGPDELSPATDAWALELEQLPGELLAPSDVRVQGAEAALRVHMPAGSDLELYVRVQDGEATVRAAGAAAALLEGRGLELHRALGEQGLTLAGLSLDTQGSPDRRQGSDTPAREDAGTPPAEVPLKATVKTQHSDEIASFRGRSRIHVRA